MDYTSFEDSLAAINGLPVVLESKPATDFATYIQTLIDNPAPSGFMLSGRAPSNAEEELELKKAGEELKKLVPSMFAGEGHAGDGFDSADNGVGFSMGIGKATDSITSDAITAAIRGFLTGGLFGAATKGLQSYAGGMLGLQNTVNSTPDPLGTLAALQGWSPVPVDTSNNTYSDDAIAESVNNAANAMSVDPGVVAAAEASDAAGNAAAAATMGIGIDAFGGIE